MIGTPLPLEIEPEVTEGHVAAHRRLHDWFNGTGNVAVITDEAYGAVHGGSAATNAAAINAAVEAITATGEPGWVVVPPGMNFPVTPDVVMGASDVLFTGGGTISTTQSTFGALITFPAGSEDFAVVGLRFIGGSERIVAVYTPSTSGNICRRGLVKDNVAINCTMGLTNDPTIAYASRDTDPVTGNVTRNIDFINNRGGRFAANLGDRAFILLHYAIGGVIAGNSADGYPYGIQWWGGDANPAEDGAIANERKCGEFAIYGNRMTNVLDVGGGGAGIWGSMGYGITATGNHVENCGDVGIDFEGCIDCTATGNTVINCTNGCLTTFSFNRSVHFVGNVARQDTAGTTIVRVQNATGSTENKEVSFVGNTLSCTAAGNSTVTLETAQRTTFKDNTCLNVRVTAHVNNQRNVTVQDNDFLFTLAAGAAFNAIHLGGNHIGGRAIITGNTIESLVAQPVGSRAILSDQDDPNTDVLEFIDGNRCFGFTKAIETIWNGANPGFTARTFIRHNVIDVGATIVNTRGAASLATGIAAVVVKEGNYYANGTAVP